ncbi:MAG TPA: family 16 glycosylhydrolase [Acetobacteraceae bacterium]|nr:family 16 glycosylhydrolase [Acetobacteraceae bacterium]
MTAKVTFDDTFAKLRLWQGTSGIWQPSYDWSPDGYMSSDMASWLVNPAYSLTSQLDADVYSVTNGTLNIYIKPRPADVPASAVDNAQFLSGMLTTEPSFSQLYGYFQITARLPVGAGTSAAFWLLPENGAWPPELDVFEVDGSQGPKAADFGVFTGQSGTTQQINTWNYNLPNLSTSFNTFAVNWTASTITWYVDGHQVYQIATPADMHTPMYMVIDDMVDSASSWNGGPAPGETGDMQVSSVEVWSSDPYTASGSSTNTGSSGSSMNSGRAAANGTSSADTTSASSGTTSSTGTGGSSGTSRNPSNGATSATTTSGGSTTGSTTHAPTPDARSIIVPASEKVAAGATAAIAGVSVSDAWAAGNAGTMALNVWDNSGTLSIAGKTFGPGDGPAGGMLRGTLAQINADLASLSYRAPGTGGTDTITIDVWNQAGVEATEQIAVTVSGGTPAVQTIAVAASNANPVELVSNAMITATAGSHMLFVGGTGNMVTLTGGTETVQAFAGHNTVTTGGNNDTIQIAGAGNVVNAGAGGNTIDDSGSDNTIVLPPARQGDDTIYGYVMQDGDTFDLRALLAATNWNGTQATLGEFIGIATSGGNAVISVTPTGEASGGTYAVATLEGSGPVSLQSLLAHAMT